MEGNAIGTKYYIGVVMSWPWLAIKSPPSHSLIPLP